MKRRASSVASAIASNTLRPTTTIQVLARSTLLESLTGPELVVYLRLLGAVGDQKSQRITIINAHLYRNIRTAVAALRSLENYGLVRISYENMRAINRTIEVSR